MTILLLVALVSPAFAGVTYFEPKVQTYVNEACRSGSCDLKRFWLSTQVFKVVQGGGSPAFGTTMSACFETSGIDKLQDYGIAQFTRGCQYSSSLQSGRVYRKQDISISHYGETKPYLFPNWTIDGFISDPLSWGADPSAPRHFHYWNRVPGPETVQPTDYFGVARPKGPMVCVRDLPGSAFTQDNSAKNISQEFRVCLYKSSDVPTSVPFDRLDFAEPIHCFDWSNSFIYDHAAEQFTSPQGIDPYCSDAGGLRR